MYRVSTTALSRAAIVRRLSYAATAIAVLFGPSARAIDFDTGNPAFTVRWDNTLKYSVLDRVGSPNAVDLANANTDDGDRNLARGIASNRIDGLSEFDLKWLNYGFTASADGWYDTKYNTSNSNNSPLTSNNLSVPYNRFTVATRDIEGRYLELGNAFIYGRNVIGNTPVNWRVGRYTLIWGESLLFPDNGVAYGQSPVDAIKIASVPNTQAKELFLPTTQASAQVTLTDKVSVEAFSKFEWRETRIPAAGSYFSAFDAVGQGAERIFFLPPGTPNLAFPGGGYAIRGSDMRGSGLGQFGVALKFRPTTNWDLGLYAERYNDTSPQLYFGPLNFAAPFTPAAFGGTPVMGSYREVYPEGVQLYGMSASTTLGNWNVAGETSIRHNSPLVSSVILDARDAAVADNSNNPAYAIGNTLHAQLSTIYIGPASPLYQGITALGEIAGVRVLDIYKNPTNFDQSRSRSALGARIVLQPQYYQVLSGVDLTVPIGLGWNFDGRSPTETFFNGSGADHGGDLSVGLVGTWRNLWIATLNYTNYFGKAVQTFNQNGPDYIMNPLIDRNFVSLSIQRTF
jgi:hypothetical protein